MTVRISLTLASSSGLGNATVTGCDCGPVRLNATAAGPPAQQAAALATEIMRLARALSFRRRAKCWTGTLPVLPVVRVTDRGSPATETRTPGVSAACQAEPRSHGNS